MDNYHNNVNSHQLQCHQNQLNLVVIITFKPTYYFSSHQPLQTQCTQYVLPSRLSSITSLTSIQSMADNSDINNINIPINENINLMEINTNNNTISMNNVSTVSKNKKRISFPSRLSCIMCMGIIIRYISVVIHGIDDNSYSYNCKTGSDKILNSINNDITNFEAENNIQCDAISPNKISNGKNNIDETLSISKSHLKIVNINGDTNKIGGTLSNNKCNTLSPPKKISNGNNIDNGKITIDHTQKRIMNINTSFCNLFLYSCVFFKFAMKLYACYWFI